MRSRVFLLTVILVAVSFFAPLLRLTARASEPLTDQSPAGLILYRQSFADVSDYAKSGVRTGTSIAEDAQIGITDGELNVRTRSGRVYTLFPDVERGASYTVEFTFRLSESGRENGSFGCLLTCRGDEPTNVTALTIRGNGTIDDFTAPEELAKAIRGGMTVGVQIPVEDGAFHRMRMTVGEDVYELERGSIVMIPQGGWGFSFRNTSAAISEVEVVSGTDYAEKTGDTASWATDEDGAETVVPVSVGKAAPPTPAKETAPDTRDRFRERAKNHTPVAVTSASVLTCGFVIRGRKRKTRADGR